jgi:hypothetical protein
MGQNLIGWAAVGLVLGLALPPAWAGERKLAAVNSRGVALRKVVFVAPARSAGENFAGGGNWKGQGRRELSFSAVSPLRSEAGNPATAGKQRSEVGSAKPGPTTAPSERKTMKLFQLDPRLGDVSVQPVVGGVNGAQLSVGF